jgi:hypothetical protein
MGRPMRNRRGSSAGLNEQVKKTVADLVAENWSFHFLLHFSILSRNGWRMVSATRLRSTLQ